MQQTLEFVRSLFWQPEKNNTALHSLKGQYSRISWVIQYHVEPVLIILQQQMMVVAVELKCVQIIYT